MGRPKLTASRDVTLAITVSRLEKASISVAAKKSGRSVSDYIRTTVMRGIFAKEERFITDDIIDQINNIIEEAVHKIQTDALEFNLICRQFDKLPKEEQDAMLDKMFGENRSFKQFFIRKKKMDEFVESVKDEWVEGEDNI